MKNAGFQYLGMILLWVWLHCHKYLLEDYDIWKMWGFFLSLDVMAKTQVIVNKSFHYPLHIIHQHYSILPKIHVNEVYSFKLLEMRQTHQEYGFW